MPPVRPLASNERPARPRARSIHIRERLLRHLDETTPRAAVWIGAPAGSGKSTLASSWVEARRRAYVWHQLEEGDREPATLFHFLASAAPSSRSSALPHLGAEYVSDLQAFAASFFDAFYARLAPGSVLVLDDAHLLENSAAEAAIVAAVARRPPEVSLVLTARGRPPPAYARLLADGALTTLDGERLRFTPEEAARMLEGRRGRPLDAALAERLCAQTEGWAAGLALLGNSLTAGARLGEPTADEGLSVVFDYFAAELFDALSPEQQALLLHTAVAPRISPGLARTLTGDRKAKALLERLWRDDVFIRRGSERSGLYELHPLFRSFLLHRASQSLDPTRLRELRRLAAAGLEEAGLVDAAADLLMEAQAHESLRALVRRRASELEKARRWATLERWIRALPEHCRQEDPWLVYLLGVSRLPFDTVEARAHFEVALASFRARRDRTGAFLSWARGVESIILEYGTFEALDGWLETFEALDRELGFALSVEAFVRVSVSRFDALLHRRPLSPELAVMERRLRRLMTVVPDLSARVMLGACLTRYYAVTGDLPSAHAVRTRLGKQVESAEIEPAVRAVWAAMSSVLGWIVGSPRAGFKAAHEALEVTRTLGIRLFDFRILVQATYSALAMGRIDDAESLLARMPDTFSPERKLDMGQHVWLIGWAQLVRGNTAAGLEHMREGIDIAESVGVPYVLARAHHGLAQALRAAGQVEEARRSLELCRDLVKSSFPLVTYIARLSEAELCFDENDEEGGRAILASAFALGVRHRYAPIPHWTPRQLAALCARALEAGLYPDYAREVVRIHELQAHAPGRPIEGWPWPVALRTLGPLSLVKDGTEEATRALTGKPLELLLALVALGAEGVHDSRLVEALWPDADGDRGRDALKMTLSRLRRVVGAEAIEVVDRRLSLRPDLVWVDASALSDVLDRLLEGPLPDDAGALLDEANALFRGPFLQALSDPWWALPLRERLEGRYVRAVERVGGALEMAGQKAEAADLYRQGVEVLPRATSLRAALRSAFPD